MDANGELKPKTTTITIVRTPFQLPCPVCEVMIRFMEIGHYKDGELQHAENKKAKGERHSVRECIRDRQIALKKEAGWNQEAEICRNCERFYTDYYCSSEEWYCTHPDFVFEKDDDVIEFQKRYERMDFVTKPRTHEPARTIYAYTERNASCDKFERKGTHNSGTGKVK